MIPACRQPIPTPGDVYSDSQARSMNHPIFRSHRPVATAVSLRARSDCTCQPVACPAIRRRHPPPATNRGSHPARAGTRHGVGAPHPPWGQESGLRSGPMPPASRARHRPPPRPARRAGYPPWTANPVFRPCRTRMRRPRAVVFNNPFGSFQHTVAEAKEEREQLDRLLTISTPRERLLVVLIALLLLIFSAWLFFGNVSRTVAVEGVIAGTGTTAPFRRSSGPTPISRPRSVPECPRSWR